MTEEAKAYTPTTEQVREACILAHYTLPSSKQRAELGADFDRWLATVKAQALNDVADQMRDRFTAAWLRGKANEHIHGPRKIVGAFATPESNQEADSGDQGL